MPQVTASEFRDNLDGLRYAMNSFRGCLRNERPNESAILRRAMGCVETMNLIRRNDQLEKRREQLIITAEQLLTSYQTVSNEVKPSDF